MHHRAELGMQTGLKMGHSSALKMPEFLKKKVGFGDRQI